ncbi:MAG: type III secretion system gatekeeper subunit SctW [Duodenibacillus sp.]|nr:type III secretion system gatekeeper subunit SctW [Duodenibacillus sp.]
MTIDAINAGFQTNFAQTQATNAAGGAEGLFMGHTVAVKASPESLLADAAEEVGFAVNTTDDYEIKDRKQREATDISRRLIELYQAMMLKNGQAEKLDETLESLKRADSRQTMQRVLEEAYGDVSDRWAALEYALARLEADPSVTDAQKSALKAFADDFGAQHAAAIKLGIQGGLAAQDYPELDGARELYRQTVGEFSSVNEVFADIKSRYGNDFHKAMDFLFAAISSDIDCETPSMGKAHLESVHAKLGVVRLTQSAYKLCDDVMVRWRDVHGIANCPMTGMDLLGEIVGLRDRNFLSAFQIRDICMKALPPDLEHEVIFTQELFSAVRKFPPALFNDEKGLMIVMDAVQSAVDDVVNREDEYLASLE